MSTFVIMTSPDFTDEPYISPLSIQTSNLPLSLLSLGLCIYIYFCLEHAVNHSVLLVNIHWNLSPELKHQCLKETLLCLDQIPF